MITCCLHDVDVSVEDVSGHDGEDNDDYVDDGAYECVGTFADRIHVTSLL